MGRIFFSLLIYVFILFSAFKILKPIIEKEKNSYFKMEKNRALPQLKTSNKINICKQILCSNNIENSVAKLEKSCNNYQLKFQEDYYNKLKIEEYEYLHILRE